MKKNIYLFLVSSVLFLSCGPLITHGTNFQDQQEQLSPQNKGIVKTAFKLIRNMEPINLVFVGIALFFGTWWKLGRNKIKQLGELALKFHEYTDDKVLDKKERADLLRRVFQLIGKAPASPPPKKTRRRK